MGVPAVRSALTPVLLALALASCAQGGSPVDVDDGSAGAAARAWAAPTGPNPLTPLPTELALDPQRVALGRTLFNDKRLSGDGLVSCSDCHNLGLGGANGQAFSTLPGRKPVGFNVPTVFNVEYEFRYAWNGRFTTLEAQIDFALTAAAAMGSSWTHVVSTLAKDAALVAVFGAAYPDGLNAVTARDALVQYVRSLVTPNSRFDRFLRGERPLLAAEQHGYDLFRDYGCVSCHQGINVGGNMYQRFGVMLDYFEGRGAVKPADLGRYGTTHDERDRHVFRVPSLRNVALTAPYFHDGSAATLQEAITIMGRYQLGRELSAADSSDIAAFLRALTGELEGRPL